jgi:1-acyl-sn-glycerol-3-phosphate acyltransferase
MVIILVYPITKHTLMPLITCFLKSVQGKENIPKKGPFIIVANHESWLDGILIDSFVTPLINKQIHFIASKGRFWDVLGDKICRDWAGCILLGDDKKKAFDELFACLKRGEIIALFPEGIHKMDGKLKRGRTGAVRLALKSHAQIIPVGIIGTYEITPHNRLIPNLKRAKLSIGEPIYLKSYYNKKIDYKTLRKLTDDLMKVISKLAGKPYNP